MGERNIPRLLGIIAVVCIAVGLVIFALGTPAGTPAPAENVPSPPESAAGTPPTQTPAARTPPATPPAPPPPLPSLHELASRADVPAIRERITAGADVNAPYPGDDPALRAMTPLMIAARDADPATLAALLEAGADPARAADDGRTALMLASGAGDVRKVEMLLTAGSPVNARAGDGRTALMFAARSAGPELVTLLLDFGADPTPRDESGRTAADIAAGRTDDAGRAVAGILREAGKG